MWQKPDCEGIRAALTRMSKGSHAKKNEFKTIASCYSFTREDMIEMWIMNHAGNKLL